MRVPLLPLFTALTLGSIALVAVSCGDSAADPPVSSAVSTGSSSSMGAGGASSSSGPGGSAGAGGSGAGGNSAGSGGSGGTPRIDTCGIGQLPGSGGAGGDGSGGDGFGGDGFGGAGQGSARVRVVAANLSSGNNQSYDGGHGIRILQGLDADVVLMQEMNFGSNSLTAIDSLVDQACSGNCNYIRGPQEQIPNGMLSRLPILECGSWTDPEVQNRNFVWARLDVPGSNDLWAISVHLLSSSASKRALEASALLDQITANIPANDMIVIGGDLNTNSRGEAAVTLLASMFDTAGPYPADQQDNDMTNAPRSKPYDWVLADAELTVQEVPVVIGMSVFPFGAVIDTREYMPLSEIAPAQFSDSDAPSMQHMAVVKDFQIEAAP